MSDPILTIARSIFSQKYKELVEIRNQLKAKTGAKDSPLIYKKLKDYEKLFAELERNYKKADRIIKEIGRLVRKNK